VSESDGSGEAQGAQDTNNEVTKTRAVTASNDVQFSFSASVAVSVESVASMETVNSHHFFSERVGETLVVH
jgi:hypothetical protein